MIQLLNSYIDTVLSSSVHFLREMLMPAMLFVFTTSVLLRTIIYYTVRRQLWFVREFEKRVYAELDGEIEANPEHFFRFARRLLERTYFEVFELRSRYKRRNPDHIMTVSDRVFLIQDGTARLIADSLKHLRYFQRSGRTPNMTDVAKAVFNANPAFSRVFGVIPASFCNSILNILPSMLIVGGIFGTFMGFMNALPQLAGMDLTNAEATKVIMDRFLVQMAHSLAASVLGIMLSVSLNVFNTAVDPEGLFVTIVDRYSSVLSMIWNRCQVVPGTLYNEDEESRPMNERELEAREAITRQLNRVSRVRYTREEVTTEPQNLVAGDFEQSTIQDDSRLEPEDRSERKKSA